jgi:uncharacterized OsmC-like protein
MSTREITAALQRAESVLRRRPEMGLHNDSLAAARWGGGTRVVTAHPNGTEIPSDMPTELGGTGDRITPGWLFRAGLAACSATTIAMAAAAQQIELDALEVHATSKSDTRALLGIPEADGGAVYAGPSDVRLAVRIAAKGVAPERLRELVESAMRRSPIACVLPNPTPVDLAIDVASA